MKPKRIQFTTTSGFIILCTFGCLVFLTGCRSHEAPKDQELIAIFQDHVDAFHGLQQMAAEDVQRGWYLGISEKSKMSEARWQKYKQLISEIHPNLDVTMDGYGDGMRFIFAYGRTTTGSEWGKGIEFLPGSHEGAGVVLTNIDDAQTLPDNVYLRPIGSNWFLFYQRTD